MNEETKAADEREERDLENCDFLPLPQVTLQLVHFPYFQKYSGSSTSFSKLEPLRTVYSYFIPGLFSWKRSWTTFIVHFNHKISNQNTLFSVFRTTRLGPQRSSRPQAKPPTTDHNQGSIKKSSNVRIKGNILNLETAGVTPVLFDLAILNFSSLVETINKYVHWWTLFEHF